MALFTLPHMQVSASGTLGTGGGNEIWTMGFKVGVSALDTSDTLEIPTQDDMVQCANLAVTNLSALISSDVGGGPFAGLISNWCALTRVTVASVGVDSHRPSNRNTEIRDLNPVVRGVANAADNNNPYAQTPYQVAVVATLRGDFFRSGPAAYGRFYLPVPNLHVDSNGISAQAMVDGLMSPTTTQDFATACGLFVANSHVLSTVSGLYQRVWNVSASQIQNNVRAQRVTEVSVDNRPDTIRRRSNRLSGQGRKTVVIS